MTAVRGVKTLPKLPGRAAWNAILPEAPPSLQLSENQTADVVIVGGGFAGLSAARRLKQLDPALRVMVLEATRIAEGSAGRNSGFMIDLPHELTSEDYAGAGDDRALISLNRQAIAFAKEAVEDYEIDPNYFDPAGKVNGAVSSKAVRHNESYAVHLDSLGEPYELLGAEAMKVLTGSHYYMAGLYTPGTVMLQPAGYIRGLATGVRRDGVEIFENTPVETFSREGSGWQLKCGSNSVSCQRVVLAVNGHLASFGFHERQLMQVFLYAVMTPELDAETCRKLGGASRWGITPSDPMGTTVRRIDSGQGGNRIVTRTCAELKQGMQPSHSDVQRAAKVMQGKFDQRFPALAGMKMEYEWAGHLCLTLNSVSVARQLEHGFYSACAQNGLGTTRGTLTGIAAAELALGQVSAITSFFAAETTPKTLPPEPFLSIGANATMRWKEWKAAKE